MNALVPTLADRIRRLPPALTFALGLMYVLGVAALDYFHPARMSCVLLYLPGLLFVAWSSERWAATVLAVIVAAGMYYADYHLNAGTLPVFTLAWNALSRLCVLVLTAWLMAEVARLNRDLGRAVEERTLQWEAESKQHLATSIRLVEALERFEQIARNILEVFWLYDPGANRFLYVSPGFERIWGRKCQELYDSPHCWDAALHPADRASLLGLPLLEKVKGPYEVQYRILQPDGSVRWIRDRAFPVRNAQGEVQRVAGLAEDITAWKTAWETLSTQACILEHMKEAVLMSDELGVIHQSNAAAGALLGYSPSELLGRTLQSFSTSSTGEAEHLLQAALEQIQARGFTTGEYRVRRKDGSWIWVATQANIVTVGERSFLVVVGQDITERKRTEEALRLSQTQLAEAMDLARLAHWEYDVASGMFTFDDRYFRLYGTTAEREGGQRMSPQAFERAFLLPEDADLVTKGVRQALASTDPNNQTQIEHRMRRRDGEIRHVSVRFELTKDATGRTVAIRGVTQDITERKQAEQQLADALDLNQRILAASPMGIIAYQATGQCVFANETLARLIGGTNGEHLRQDFRQLPTWKRDGLLALAEKTLTEGKPQAAEIHGRSSFGKEVWMDFHMVPFTQGDRPHLLCMVYDISDRRRLERQVLEISDREQARIGQDLHDGLCQQLVSLAFDANSLESGLARENHPQTGVARRIADLLDQSITEARNLSRGLFPVRLEADGLASAFEELARFTRAHAQVDCRVADGEPIRIGDRAMATQLYRIAQEAVNNAVKHARARSIRIELLAQAGQFQLRVTDDGNGLPSSPPTEPQGLGLHIMDYRARSLGGSLTVSPGPRGGTTVCCCVPGPGSSKIEA